MAVFARQVFIASGVLWDEEQAMTLQSDKIDILPGVLKGHAFTCECTVALTTRLTTGGPANTVWTSLQITSSEQQPPDGTYHLVVHGRVFETECEGGKWPTLEL